uniref:Uncharacterized protein n=1 Tax=Mycena chlorophos TaxID=658473 RepID=A0ABQ0LN35_MYCCL|nr:predicted protein [Mycena chlorophos]
MFWKPNWESETAEGMRAKVAQALAAAPNGWVVDGNFGKRIGGLVEDPSTDEIWLDPPLLLYIPRLIVRTFARMLGLVPPCREGCNETLSTFFSRENIVLWSIQNHGVARRREGARFEKIGLGIGTDVEGRKMRRIGGWGSELTAWMESIRAMIRSQLRHYASEADLLARPRSLNREWRGAKTALPKYDSLPRLRLLPIGQRPIFTCPSPQCGLTHFFADLPLCPWCRGSSDGARRAYQLTTPRSRTRSEMAVRWRVEDSNDGESSSSNKLGSPDEKYRRRQTISIVPPLPSLPTSEARRSHHRSRSTPANQLRPKRQPIYTFIRGSSGWQSPRSLSPPPSSRAPSSLASAHVSSGSVLGASAPASVESHSVSLPSTPISESGRPWLQASNDKRMLLFQQEELSGFSSLLPITKDYANHELLLEAAELNSGLNESFSFSHFSFPPPPEPLPPLDTEEMESLRGRRGQRRGSLAGLLGSLATKHKEAERRAELATLVGGGDSEVHAGSYAGLRTLKKLVPRRWSIGGKPHSAVG